MILPAKRRRAVILARSTIAQGWNYEKGFAFVWCPVCSFRIRTPVQEDDFYDVVFLRRTTEIDIRLLELLVTHLEEVSR